MAMKGFKSRNLRLIIQVLVILTIISIIIVYGLYTNEMLDFKILGISDMNPYGGWSAFREYVTDSNYEFEGISLSMALTIALLAMAIIGGRFFCGWLCPVGAIQDFASRIGRRLKILRYKVLDNKAYTVILKYLILLAILIVSISGYGAIISVLSPWRAFLSSPKTITAWAEMKIGFIIILIIFIASIFVSRFFCRYLCPLGAAQSLFSSFSPLSIKHEKSCRSCNKCLEECPVGISFSSESNTISPECIRCLKCVEDCKANANSRVYIGFSDRKVPAKPYILLMIVLFFVIWIGVPKLLGGHAGGEDIPIGALKDGTYLGESKGFASKIITEVKVIDGKVTEINIIDHKESKGWYEEAFMTIPREIIRKQKLNVDATSGATKSSKGLIKSVENALKRALN